MHIGIDAHAIGAQQGGNETYIRNLIRALAQLDGANHYTIYLTERRAAHAWNEEFVTAYKNFKIQILPKPTPIVRVPVFLAYELRRRPVDVLPMTDGSLLVSDDFNGAVYRVSRAK